MNISDLYNNPSLKNIDPAKLQILTEILSNANNKSTKEILPYFLAASQKASKMGVAFTNSETDLIMEILTQNLSSEEKARVETIRKLSTLIAGKKK